MFEKCERYPSLRFNFAKRIIYIQDFDIEDINELKIDLQFQYNI